MSQPKIIDNFLTASYHKELVNYISNDTFPWFFKNDITKNEKNFDVLHYGFQHEVINKDGVSNSSIFSFVQPMFFQIMDEVKCSTMLRCRIDMVNARNVKTVFKPHVDMSNHVGNKTIIYYLLDSDGDTILYTDTIHKNKQMSGLVEKKRVTPKANRLLIFDGNVIHTGESPMRNKQRILFNINVE